MPNIGSTALAPPFVPGLAALRWNYGDPHHAAKLARTLMALVAVFGLMPEVGPHVGAIPGMPADFCVRHIHGDV